VAVIVIVISIPAIVVTGAVPAVVVRIPVRVIPVIIMPVVRSPGRPVTWVIAPVPGRAPYHIVRTVDEADDRPCSYFIIGSPDHIRLVCPDSATGVARIRCLSIIGFDYIIFAIKGFITDQLYLNRPVFELFNNKDSHILLIFAVNRDAQNYVVDIAFLVIGYCYVIHVFIGIQVKVIDP
jgi:hypothetical protein